MDKNEAKRLSESLILMYCTIGLCHAIRCKEEHFVDNSDIMFCCQNTSDCIVVS